MREIVFKRFVRSEEGSQTIAFLVLLPLLVWSIMAMLTFTDAFRVRGMATDATAVIADAQLTGYEVSLRVTQVRCILNCDSLDRRILAVDFSQGIGLDSLLDLDFIAGLSRERVPLMANGDRLVLVETSFMHEPIAQIGLEGTEGNVSALLGQVHHQLSGHRCPNAKGAARWAAPFPYP